MWLREETRGGICDACTEFMTDKVLCGDVAEEMDKSRQEQDEEKEREDMGRAGMANSSSRGNNGNETETLAQRRQENRSLVPVVESVRRVLDFVIDEARDAKDSPDRKRQKLGLEQIEHTGKGDSLNRASAASALKQGQSRDKNDVPSIPTQTKQQAMGK